MEIVISESPVQLGKAAAENGARLIRQAIQQKNEANIIVATGASQFEMLNELIKKDIDWTRVTGFHLDEYIGLPETHNASFRKYLKERFVDQVPMKKFHYVNGENNPQDEWVRLGEIIGNFPVDVAFIGIGENAHLAFNDPPADFETEEAFLVVKLDEQCRLQQLGEGWFSSFDEIPEFAISMSVKQILKSKSIICSVPDKRKAEAVRKTLDKIVTPEVPASILQGHPSAWLYLDKDSASLLK